jgi:uncharacterized protein YjbI with pentapeptide repeats
MDGHDLCMAHVDFATLEQHVRDHPIDGRGVSLSTERLAIVLAALRRLSGGTAELCDAKFDYTRFAGHAVFRDVVFSGTTRFQDAVFTGHARFEGAKFRGRTSFERVSFLQEATFTSARFGDRAVFNDADFRMSVSFTAARFRSARFLRTNMRHPSLQGARFGAFADFEAARVFGASTFSSMIADEGISLKHVVFEGDVDFRDGAFTGRTSFDGAHFESAANFDGTRFIGSASFSSAHFLDVASFRRPTRFSRDALFRKTNFGGEAGFQGVAFDGPANFNGSRFENVADFTGVAAAARTNFACSFDQDARFLHARFERDTYFRRADFGGAVSLEQATFAGDAVFRRATFRRAVTLGPMTAVGQVVFDDVSTAEPVHLEVTARSLRALRANFIRGVRAQIEANDLSFAGSTFGGASSLSTSTAPSPDATKTRTPRPKLMSLQGCDVNQLTLAGFDASQCNFGGAIHLEGVHIDRTVVLARPPLGRTRRDVINEEIVWRATRRVRWGWPTSDARERTDAQGVASVYRALRKGREDRGDAAGAADFYYGEMEMRRVSSRVGERILISLYWLFSGYGLRAVRPLATLLVVVVAAAVVLQASGFKKSASATATPKPALIGVSPLAQQRTRVGRTHALSWRSVLTSAESATAVAAPSDASLTYVGRVVRIILRITGPLLLGLTLLAVRGRVRR